MTRACGYTDAPEMATLLLKWHPSCAPMEQDGAVWGSQGHTKWYFPPIHAHCGQQTLVTHHSAWHMAALLQATASISSRKTCIGLHQNVNGLESRV